MQPGRDIVEIGSYLGRSTAYLALGAPPGCTVHAVDPFNNGSLQLVRGERMDTSKQFLRNMEEIGVSDRVEAHVGTSVEGAASYRGRPVGLLFVDGDHSAEAVFADGSSWAPHLAPGCLLAFDDITWAGVTDGLRRLADEGVLPPAVGRVDKIGLSGPATGWPARVRALAEPFDPARTTVGATRRILRGLVLPTERSGPNPNPQQ